MHELIAHSSHLLPLCPACASFKLAPIEVPERISCLLNVLPTSSISSKNWQTFTIVLQTQTPSPVYPSFTFAFYLFTSLFA